MIKTTRIWVAVLSVLVALVLVGIFGLVLKNNETTPTPAPSPSETTGSEMTPNQKLAAATSELFADITIRDIITQLGEDEANNTGVGSDVAFEDAEGVEASVAVIYFVDLPQKYDAKTSLETLRKEISEANGSDERINWEILEANVEDFEGDHILQAIKIWDSADEPSNAAIVEISWVLNPETGLQEISISSTVY